MMKLTHFAKYAWGVLVYNLAVILWGAFVRATGSGAGCGSHWPLCNGVVIPRAPQIETLIEFFHRLSSGLALLLVVGLLVWALRAYPKGHLVRRGASLAMFFMITEALVGAGLVLFQLVADNASLARAPSIAVHLVNTFLLLASLTLTAWWASVKESLQLKGPGVLSGLLGLGLLGMLVLGVSGAVTALGDTLFPVASLAEGLRQDFSPTAHLLIRLRLLHPLIAVAVALYLMLVAALCNSARCSPVTKWLGRALTLLLLIQLGAGTLNVALLAPVWMQLVHLFLSDLVWMTLVLLTVSTLVRREAYAEMAGLSRPQLGF
jgi:heme A synthase